MTLWPLNRNSYYEFIGRTHGTYEGQIISTIDYLEKLESIATIKDIKTSVKDIMLLMKLRQKI